VSTPTHVGGGTHSTSPNSARQDASWPGEQWAVLEPSSPPFQHAHLVGRTAPAPHPASRLSVKRARPASWPSRPLSVQGERTLPGRPSVAVRGRIPLTASRRRGRCRP
jgi:hypothetical protein